MGFDQRKNRRLRAAFPVEFLSAMNGENDVHYGTTLNLSETGAGFASQVRLRRNDVLVVGFRLPGSPRILRLTAGVVACQAAEEPGRFEVRVRFIEPSGDEKKILQTALETLRS
jgi:hypothetical protein